MQKYILVILIVLSCTNIIAQDISIEFSIERKEKLDFQFKELQDHVIRPAYLHITYRNISDRPLYCLKISEGKFDLPEIIYLYEGNIYPMEHVPYYDYNYCNYNYIVGFKSNPYYTCLTWNIRDDTTSFSYLFDKKSLYDRAIESGNYFGPRVNKGDMLDDGIFSTLDNIYNFIFHHYYPYNKEKENKILQHFSSDITSDTIKNKSIDKFVFLMPGEAYIDTYNLIGFQITGGTFTFRLDDAKSLDYVETEPVYKDETNFIIDYYTKKQLPEKVGEYELFRGEFLTNQVTVQFPGIRLKK